MKDTWIKVVEYASKPHQGLSRKIRPGYSIQFNDCSKPLSGEVIFEIYEDYLRVIAEDGTTMTNAYYDWNAIGSIITISTK